MSFHARPIPIPAHVPGGRNDTAQPQVRLASPVDDPPATPPPTSSADTSHSAPMATSSTAYTASTAARDTPWPWYRREPWLSVVLAAFVPIAVGFATPQEFHALLLGLSGLLLVMSIAMLIRQGPFTEHPRPKTARRSAGSGIAPSASTVPATSTAP